MQRRLGVWLGLAMLLACEERSPVPPPIWVDPETIPPEFNCTGVADQRICNGNWSALCDDKGRTSEEINCRLQELSCVPGVGCRLCTPNGLGCNADNQLFTCNADGDAYEVSRTCEVGTVCNAAVNGCVDLCQDAEASRSYVGCDYWAVVTSNSQLDGPDGSGVVQPRAFTFEIVISNPQNIDAQVSVSFGGAVLRDVSVPPATVRRVDLPWVEDLVGRGDAHTTLALNAGYHVQSSVPVTIYQFNPMEFQQTADGISQLSFTNDASLLLPTHVLTGSYTVISRGSLAAVVRGGDPEPVRYHLPGFVSIVGVDDQDVDVEVVSSAFTMASPDGTVPALSPGQSARFLLGPGDVLQLQTAGPELCDEDPVQDVLGNGSIRTYCLPDPDYDLTGTTIRANGKVSVFGGHDCARVPYNVSACDHLEENLFPEEAWGKSVPLARSVALPNQRDVPDVAVVLSAHDNNRITFQPPVHDEVVLNRGDHIELIVNQDVVITGTEALLVAQYLVGQEYGDVPATTGDPAMCLGIPAEQWRNNYAFTIPSTYEFDFVNVIAPTGAPITLDDEAVTNFRPIEGTSLSTARITVRAGQHRMSAPTPFGITVYGYARYTSYAYPGGLDLRVINGPD